jgi:hypothetical protein
VPRATLANDIVVNQRTKTLAIAAVLLMGIGITYVAVTRLGSRNGVSETIDGGDVGARADAMTARVTASSSAAPSTSASQTPTSSEAKWSARWGSAKGELGRSRPQEGNPEGPMSFALAGNDLLVLDQVNGRVARYDADGKLKSTSDAPQTVQDIAVAKDGTAALLDRLAGKTITLLDPSGRKIGELPLDKARVGEPGLTTGVFVDGKNVYVEKEHGALVLVGTIDGKPPPEDGVQELAGRPSKDGTLLLTAVLQPAEGRAILNAQDRKSGSLRFARSIPYPKPLRGIVLLDTDAQGTIYLGTNAGSPPATHIACLDASDGRVKGRVALQTSPVPEESFRDLAVGDDGTIVYAIRTEDGVSYRTARCP